MFYNKVVQMDSKYDICDTPETRYLLNILQSM